MGATAIQILAEAYREHNLTEPVNFFPNQEFPLNIAKDIINKVIREMNRLGNLWFTETSTQLLFSAGVNTYDLSTSSYLIDPKRIRYIRKEAQNHQNELEELNKRDFLREFRSSPIQTGEPTAFTEYGNILELNVIPDQDYQLIVYHYKDMPQVTLPSDTFMVPERDEDILIESCAHILASRIGKMDPVSAMQLIRANTAPFLVQTKSDAGMPKQMPAAF